MSNLTCAQDTRGTQRQLALETRRLEVIVVRLRRLIQVFDTEIDLSYCGAPLTDEVACFGKTTALTDSLTATAVPFARQVLIHLLRRTLVLLHEKRSRHLLTARGYSSHAFEAVNILSGAATVTFLRQ